MGSFLVKLITGLAMTVGILAIAWFGGPQIYKHVMEGEVAKQTVQTQAVAIKSDTAAANRAQRDCSAEIAASVKAGAAIAKISQPVTNKPGQEQLVTAAEIQEAIQ